ncbi:hypothetical protein EsDP_00005620 [Epichloe bromicola]|uniref:Protection of telomeres protein 1 ssDNA-binding domain-containing protein n=2 Tax=Epichloe bromicola TaxID=79588 RepID=A0ABQ0CV75_9HYPO
MATLRSARQGKPPPGFASIQDIIDRKHQRGSRVNVAGIVTDFRAPIATKGEVQDDPEAAVLLNIFRPENEMPDARGGDVVIVFAAKVQEYQHSYSLCTHKTTDVYVFNAARIPKTGADASKAMRPTTRSQTSRRPNRAESEFVSVLYGSINKERLPTASEFETMKLNSTNVKKKFSELKDVQDNKFVDTVAQIVREPYDLGDKITLWVSDYTENPLFYQHQLMGGKGQQTDPFGYTTRSGASLSKSEWSGPFGKLSMQVTCFEPHASVIRDEKLTVGMWVSLRNLQIKYGHNMTNLEGYLREERGTQCNKINISQEFTHDSETTRTEVKNALRRKLHYERTKRTQIKEITEAATAGAKRRADLGLDGERASKLNAKARRNLKRAHKGQSYKEQERDNGEAHPKDNVPGDVPSDLNTHVKCENGNKSATPIADVLMPVQHETLINGEMTHIPLPFINANYRTYVRVIDYLPSQLEGFAHPKRVSSEYAALSDNEDTDSDAATESDEASRVIKQWEWRFYLRLEEANASEDGKPKKSLWAVVDNQSAQMLLNLDATDLRNDDENLARLRQRMFILWGDLEEHKAQLENRALKSRPFTNAGPPTDSDDEEEAPAKQVPVQTFSNRPFGCCIRQYGVKLKTGHVDDGDEGGRVRAPWQRMFGLFGTRISGV